MLFVILLITNLQLHLKVSNFMEGTKARKGMYLDEVVFLGQRNSDFPFIFRACMEGGEREGIWNEGIVKYHGSFLSYAMGSLVGQSFGDRSPLGPFPGTWILCSLLLCIHFSLDYISPYLLVSP